MYVDLSDPCVRPKEPWVRIESGIWERYYTPIIVSHVTEVSPGDVRWFLMAEGVGGISSGYERTIASAKENSDAAWKANREMYLTYPLAIPKLGCKVHDKVHVNGHISVKHHPRRSK